MIFMAILLAAMLITHSNYPEGKNDPRNKEEMTRNDY